MQTHPDPHHLKPLNGEATLYLVTKVASIETHVLTLSRDMSDVKTLLRTRSPPSISDLAPYFWGLAVLALAAMGRWQELRALLGLSG